MFWCRWYDITDESHPRLFSLVEGESQGAIETVMELHSLAALRTAFAHFRPAIFLQSAMSELLQQAAKCFLCLSSTFQASKS